jgi:DNA-directed RNA polymerase subunit RPC12/RpoP
MGKSKKPTGKVEVTLFFDSQDQAEWFGAYWLDGGGDQQMGQTYTERWGKNWYYMKTSENACPSCGYLDRRFYDVEQVAGTLYQCPNCPKKYALK